MPFNRPTLQEIRDRVRADVEARLGTSKLLRQSFLGILADALAGAVHSNHGYIEWAARQAFVDQADAEFLDRWGSIWGVSRRAASYAAGNVTFAGANGSVIPAGTRLQRADEAEYATNADATISSGTATAAVTAIDAGLAGNTQAGVSLQLSSPIAGVTTNATVAAGGLTNGLDVEGDDLYRERILGRIQEPPHGGASFDYVAWALEISGVTRAWVYPNNTGPGTVGVTFVTDDDPGGIIPDSDKVDEVQAYIDARRPVTADVTVFAPVAVALNFTIDLSPDTAVVRAAVEASLRDLIRREAQPGGTIYLSQIREAISIAAGETDHTLTSPNANVTRTAGQITTFGTITWT
ncbi:hypothetical protein VF14_18370 [Nostoc linckia z18]|uniref:Baseplate J/gp47 family protein n=3 Tax=Nostoc linckia TaxID=92942 RepID=A0A9Q5Z977_NOSLI|nr:baseplate J/gp47 family protein [Nostoc linckia]PHJ81967.1 hypothetical protein VF07_29160 [Nostoc linckia z6]PHJ92865.1 hypothetical protein VF04_27875 [Nostoc linckia z7]PHK00812.1 hypothetical protein VF08_23370 [Nostoc linckia z8]PHK09310.1 hypothetical protein VF09_15935 [Nostoc linckia z9]PHK33086.1 hypothetical protein VF14_18370 [Nostoc linckia z18]